MKAAFDLQEYTPKTRGSKVWRPIEGGSVRVNVILEASSSHDALVEVGGRVVLLGELERMVKALRVVAS